MMRNLHTQLSEIKKMEWEEFVWISDELFRQETPEQQLHPIGVAAEENDDGLE